MNITETLTRNFLRYMHDNSPLCRMGEKSLTAFYNRNRLINFSTANNSYPVHRFRSNPLIEDSINVWLL